MEKIISQNNKKTAMLLTFFLVITGSLYSSQATAGASSPVQLAYFVGFHSYNGESYAPAYVPSYRVSRGVYYWTRWRYIGYGCRSSCLIDRLTGFPIRCNRSC